MSGDIRSTRKWRAFRKQILDRDPLCQLRLEGCTGASQEVDHVIPLSEGGSPYSPGNCVGACRYCNRRKSAVKLNQNKAAKAKAGVADSENPAVRGGWYHSVSGLFSSRRWFDDSEYVWVSRDDAA